MLNQNNGNFFKKILVSLGVMFVIAAVTSVFVFYKLDSSLFKTQVPSGLPSVMVTSIFTEVQQKLLSTKSTVNILERLNFSIPELKTNFAESEKAILSAQKALEVGDTELATQNINTVMERMSIITHLKTEEGIVTLTRLNADAKKVGETISLAGTWLPKYSGQDKSQLEYIHENISKEYKVIKAQLAKESLIDIMDSLAVLIDGLVKILPSTVPADLSEAELDSAVNKFDFIHVYGTALEFDVSGVKAKLDELKAKQAKSGKSGAPDNKTSVQTDSQKSDKVSSVGGGNQQLKFNDVPGKGKKKLNKQTSGYIQEMTKKMIVAKTYEMPANKLFKPKNITSDGFAAQIALAVSGNGCGKKISDKTCKSAAAKVGILNLKALPSKKITRAQFYEMLIKAGNIPLVDSNSIKSFDLCKDVKVADKFAQVIATAKTYNIADVYKGGKCNAGKPFQRYQAVSFGMRTVQVMELLK